MSRVDTHVHALTATFRKELEAQGDPSGFHIPSWSVEEAKVYQEQLGVKKSIFSITAPGPLLFRQKPVEQAKEFCRRINEELFAIVQADPAFGMFASVPDLTHTQAALDEIAFWHGRVAGFVLLTSYGPDHLRPLYLGHESFSPIWKRFDELREVVFIHPGEAPSNMVNRFLPQPITDYPHETTRTAADLVTSGMRSKFPHVKIILSHGGGTLPSIADRIADGAALMGAQRSPAEILQDFRSFYYDTALTPNLEALLRFADPDKILFGSDFPYAPLRGGLMVTQRMEASVGERDGGAELLAKIQHSNAERLFGGDL